MALLWLRDDDLPRRGGSRRRWSPRRWLLSDVDRADGGFDGSPGDRPPTAIPTGQPPAVDMGGEPS